MCRKFWRLTRQPRFDQLHAPEERAEPIRTNCRSVGTRPRCHISLLNNKYLDGVKLTGSSKNKVTSLLICSCSSVRPNSIISHSKRTVLYTSSTKEKAVISSLQVSSLCESLSGNHKFFNPLTEVCWGGWWLWSWACILLSISCIFRIWNSTKQGSDNTPGQFVTSFLPWSFCGPRFFDRNVNEELEREFAHLIVFLLQKFVSVWDALKIRTGIPLQLAAKISSNCSHAKIPTNSCLHANQI